jgi:hypothetical protein
VKVANREAVRSILWSRCVTWLARGAVTSPLLFLLSTAAGAQGVTSAGIRGSVSGDDRRTVDARVNVSHDATGFSVEVHASGGRFLVQGLEPGGPYTITARGLGVSAADQF